jgi:glycyl-tRNA synthetase beta chain
MKSENLLIELLVEELPPKALKKLGGVFAQSIEKGLKAQGLLSTESVTQSFATPRRLGVLMSGVLEQAPERQIKQKIMPVSVGLDAHGKPTPALTKKLQSMGLAELDVGSLHKEMDGKAEAFYYDHIQAGATLQQGLQKALNDMLGELPIPKMMSYQLQSGCELPGWSTVHFVRPAHGLVALYGSQVVPVQLLGLSAGNESQGHRFESKVSPIVINDASQYERVMHEVGGVIASFEDRRASIQVQLANAAKKLGPDFHPLEDEALLDEVCALVEKPNILTCQFEPDFLQVPQECLILTMKANQKYFPLLDESGKLTHHFLVVSNIAPVDASAVVQGNERVVRPRLADAKFFFDQDKKKTLESRVFGLSKVVYHNLLGSQGERVERVCEIVNILVQMWSKNLNAQDTLSTPCTQLLKNAQQAARLAKADLLTDMVSEFPELQGTMGKYYALSEGLSEEVAFAIEDHYKPRFAGDQLARSVVGIIVAMADKLETLVGLFGVGQGPSGDKDPFALRRHALGLIRMLVERDVKIELTPLLTQICTLFGDRLKLSQAEVNDQLKNFIYDRLSSSLKEGGYAVKEIDAVISQRPELLVDVPLRVKAVHAFGELPEAPALAAANKRIGNILKKENRLGDAGVRTLEPQEITVDLLSAGAERDLYDTLQSIAPICAAHWGRQDYAQALVALAALKTPTDTFFDQVMVNDPNEQLRNNRLALLQNLHLEMNRVADLARLAA